LLLSSLAAGLVRAGAVRAQNSGGSGADLVVAVTSLPTHLDPMGYNSNDNERISQNLVENLIFYDFRTQKMKPGLASAWRMLDDTTMELDIRQGVKCHDNSDFTAEDVEYMFGPARYGAPNAPGYPLARSFLATIASVKATDRFKVQIRTTSPDPLLEQRLASWMGQVPGATAYRRSGSWEAWGQSVVGTGPYRLAEIKSGQYMRFEAFDGYWGGTPPARSFTLKLVQEVASRVAGLRTGEFDIITEIAPDQFGPIGNDPGSEIVGGPIRSIRALVYNSQHPVLKDVRVRRALNLAIDRKLIVESLFAGRTTIPNGLQMEVFGDMYIAEHKPTGYDPAAARALVAEAGYNGGEIAYRYWKDYYTAEIATAQVLQQMWKAVGLNVKLEMVETTDQALAAGQGITDISNAAYYTDPLGQLFRLYGTGGLIPNRHQWSNAEFDRVGAELFGIDHAKRRAAAVRILDIYEEDPPGTYLHTLPMFYGKRKQLGWVPTDTAFMDFRTGNLSVG
jgi:peptide/nickel transport system substrate-binding protein